MVAHRTSVKALELPVFEYGLLGGFLDTRHAEWMFGYEKPMLAEIDLGEFA